MCMRSGIFHRREGTNTSLPSFPHFSAFLVLQEQGQISVMDGNADVRHCHIHCHYVVAQMQPQGTLSSQPAVPLCPKAVQEQSPGPGRLLLPGPIAPVITFVTQLSALPAARSPATYDFS